MSQEIVEITAFMAPDGTLHLTKQAAEAHWKETQLTHAIRDAMDIYAAPEGIARYLLQCKYLYIQPIEEDPF
jgi:hypothetical protein